MERSSQRKRRGDRRRRGQRYGDHPLADKVNSEGSCHGRECLRSRDKHPIKQIENNGRNYRPRTTGASPCMKNNRESVQEVDAHWGRGVSLLPSALREMMLDTITVGLRVFKKNTRCAR